MARILIVDDDETDRVGLAAILQQAGHTVLTAGDGDEALEMFLAQRIHLGCNHAEVFGYPQTT